MNGGGGAVAGVKRDNNSKVRGYEKPWLSGVDGVNGKPGMAGPSGAP